MGPDKREGAAGQPQGRRIPIPPIVVLDAAKGQAGTKSGIPSPRSRVLHGQNRVLHGQNVSAVILSASANKRSAPTNAANKISKTLLRPSLSHACDEKDDVRQRDSGLKDISKKEIGQRDRSLKDTAPRRPSTVSEASSGTDSGRRLIMKPSHLLKNSATNCPSSSPTPGAAPKAPPGNTPGKPLPRSVSTSRERLSLDTRNSAMRRSTSVGKGRGLSSTPEQAPPQQAGAKTRPVAERPVSATGAPYRQTADKRDLPAARVRPISSSGMGELMLAGSSRPTTLKTISEHPTRSSVQLPSTALAAQTKQTPLRPALALSLTALKQQPPVLPPPQPSVEPCISISPEDSGPPVPKLDLGGILQRRAEEQASEPVFVVAASTEDVAMPSASGSQMGPDRRKSGSRMSSAKEEPAEHFYLYPKVNPQEKKRIEDICRVIPKKQQAAVTDLFGKMVEARQNCEQMCFRGHRLLDQAQAEFRNRLAQKEEEATQWRQEAEYLRTQLAILLGPRQPDETAGEAQTATAQQETGGEAERAAYLRESLLSTFDNMAQLGAGMQMATSAREGKQDVEEAA